MQAELRAQAALSVAVESYAATVGVLKQAAGNGLLSDEDCLRIEIVRQRVRAALNSWRVALAADQPPEEAIADFRRELALLLAEQAKLKEPKP